jgi:hypothetical protein
MTPIYDNETGKIISAKIDCQIDKCKELSPEAKLVFYILIDGEPLEEISPLSLGQLQTDEYQSSLIYVPTLGWEAGTYSLMADLSDGDLSIQSTEPGSLTVTPESITAVVSWKILGIIIGSTMVIISSIVVLILYRRRQMLRDYFE